MDRQDQGRALRLEIRGILADPAQRGQRLIETLAGLGMAHDCEPFRLALQSLIRLDRPEGQARGLLEAIEQHRLDLEARLGRDPGQPVAALDLLHGIEGTLREPVFRERSDTESERDRGRDPSRIDLFDDILLREVRRGERFGRPIALLLLAPDRPPSPGVDRMTPASAALGELLRDSDHAARLVPDGFGVVLPCTGGEDTPKAAERLRQAVRAATGEPWSAGVAGCPDQGWDAAAVAEAARRALRTAIDEGGDAARAYRSERRRHPRRTAGRAALHGSLRWAGGEVAARIEDLSLGGAGLGLDVSRSVPADSRPTLTIREDSVRPREVSLASRIVRSGAGPEGGDSIRLGVSFEDGSDGRFRLAALLSDLAADVSRDPAEDTPETDR